MKPILALLLILALLPSTAQAQYNEPDMVIAINDCVAILDVHTLSLIRQVDRDTGDGMYDVPMMAPVGVARINARYDDTLLMVWSKLPNPVTLRQLLCAGSPGWKTWLPR